MDWVVTGIYYAALHYIESYLALLNRHPRSNEYRERMFQELKELTPIYPDFRTLKDYSQGARYDLQRFSRDEVEDMIKNELADIRNHITSISRQRE